MNRVLNQDTDDVPTTAIRIGRGSPWDNPFRIPFDGDRAAVLARHARWLAESPKLLRALDDLKGHDLVCACAPLPCHGDLLLRLGALRQDERLAWAKSITST